MAKPPIVSLNVFPPVAMQKCELNKNNIRFSFALLVSFFLFLSVPFSLCELYGQTGRRLSLVRVLRQFWYRFRISGGFQRGNTNISIKINPFEFIACVTRSHTCLSKKKLRHNSTCNRTAIAVASRKTATNLLLTKMSLFCFCLSFS